MSKGKKIFLISIPAILILVLLWFSPFILPGRQVACEIARLRLENEPVSMSDLRKPIIPNAENAAIVYNKIFALMSNKVYIKDNNLFGDFMSASKRKLNEDIWQNIESAVSRNKDILPLLEIAISKPKCNFRERLSNDPLQNVTYYKSIHDLNRFVQAIILVKSRDGQLDEAIHYVNVALKLSDSLADEPSYIGQLTRMGVLSRTSITLRDSLESINLSEKQISELYSCFAEVNINPGALCLWRGERAQGIAYYKNYKGFALRFMGGIDPDQLNFLKQMQYNIDHVSVPLRVIKDERLYFKTEAPNFIGYSDIAPSLSDIAKMRDSCQAEISGTMITLALKAYNIKFGNYPDTLDKCEEKYKLNDFADPYSGKNFVYKRQGKGFLLYSLGPNLADDKGENKTWIMKQAIKLIGKQRFVYFRKEPTENYDIVWKIED